MAIHPSDLGEQFIRSGKRLITQQSADELLERAIKNSRTPSVNISRDPIKS
ncbi:hypothetical protein MITS9504_02156 [Synechococcus sp. MIT S9504]|nr:hypothetical protein MITS9504_02156 [Synechococcus sp. MIT S9504]